MTVRLRVKNGSQELVVSSEGRLPYCIGKAALYGTVVQPTGNQENTAPGRQAGYSVYRVTHPGEILAAFDLPLGRNVGIISVKRIDATTHEITAYCGDSPDALGFDVQSALDIWAFGFADARASAFGLVLRTDAGVLSADFTRSNPLFPQGFGDIFASPSGFQIPALGRPVALGMPAYWRSQDTPRPGSGLVSDHYETRAFWRRSNSTTLTGNTRVLRQYIKNTDTPETNGDDGPGPVFIIDGSNLP